MSLLLSSSSDSDDYLLESSKTSDEGKEDRKFGKDISNNRKRPATTTANFKQDRSMPSKKMKLGKRLLKVVTADHDDLSISLLRDSVSKESKSESKKMKKRRLRVVKVSLDNDHQSDCEKCNVKDEQLAVSFYQLFVNNVIINHW